MSTAQKSLLGILFLTLCVSGVLTSYNVFSVILRIMIAGIFEEKARGIDLVQEWFI